VTEAYDDERAWGRAILPPATRQLGLWVVAVEKTICSFVIVFTRYDYRYNRRTQNRSEFASALRRSPSFVLRFGRRSLARELVYHQHALQDFSCKRPISALVGYLVCAMIGDALLRIGF